MGCEGRAALPREDQGPAADATRRREHEEAQAAPRGQGGHEVPAPTAQTHIKDTEPCIGAERDGEASDPPPTVHLC